jgi:hypothetical protein
MLETPEITRLFVLVQAAVMLPLLGACGLSSTDTGLALAHEDGMDHVVADGGEADGISHSTGRGILALVNDPLTDEIFLAEECFVAQSAASRILAHRRGPDALDGTADDDLFDRLAELDAIAFVGPQTLALLGDAAHRLDMVPVLELEGVPFTQEQLEMTLAFVNLGSFEELDDQAALDVRAVNALVANRPFDDLVDVAARPFVGPSALFSLKVFAPSWLESRED